MGPKIVIKIIGGLLILVSSALSGIVTAASYKERVLTIRDFRRRLRILADEIRFMKGVIGDALEKAGGEKGPAAVFFRDAAIYVQTMDASSAWDLACDSEEIVSPLKKEDIQAIRLLGSQLGMSDIEGQLAVIDSVDSRMALLEEKAEELRAKNEPLFRKIGIMAGIAIIIILI